MKTTLNKIREAHPCLEGWRKLLAYLGKTEADDEELSILTVLYSTDERSLRAPDVAEAYANGKANSEELGIARSDAEDAANANADSNADAWSAAEAAYAAWLSARQSQAGLSFKHHNTFFYLQSK